MPLSANALYYATIGGARIRHAVRCTLILPMATLVDLGSAITDVRLSCSMATPLPDGVRAPSGDTTLDGDITWSGSVIVSGQLMTVADLFDRYNQASPLYRMTARDCKLTYEFGPYVRGSATPDFKTQADTWISDYTVDRAAGTVSFTLTDVPPTWDQTPAIPPIITDDAWNQYLTGEFAMDNLIRQMDGISSWPAQLPGCVLAVGMRGIAYPEVGTLDTSAGSYSPDFGPGLYGTAAVDGADNFWLSRPITKFNAEFIASCDNWTTETVVVTGVLNATDDGDGISFQTTGGGAVVQVVTTSGASDLYTFPTGTLTPGFHKFGLSVNWPMGSTTWSATLVVDGTTYNSGNRTIGHARTTTINYVFDTHYSGPFEGFQVSDAATYVCSWPTFYPHFVCDTSLNPLTAIPAIDKGTAPWDVLETIAGAECGLIQRIPDPNDATGGQLRFTNRLTLLGYDPTRGRTITSLDSLKAYTDTTPPSAAIRTVEVPYSEWDFGSPTLIWSAAARKRIKANQTVTWTQKLPDGALAASIDTTVSLLPTSGYPSSGGGSFYLVSGNASGSVAYGGTLNITLTLVSPDTVLISVTEPNGQDAWLSVPGTYSGPITAGSPALWIGGVPATVGQEALARASVGSGLGVLSVPSNAYIQDHDTAVSLSQFLSSQLSNDVDQFDGVDIVPDGTILCGDLEKVTDQYGHLDDWMLVWGWSHEASWQPAQPASFAMTADLRPLGPPGAWLAGFPGRSEAGTTDYVYAVA